MKKNPKVAIVSKDEDGKTSVKEVYRNVPNIADAIRSITAKKVCITEIGDDIEKVPDENWKAPFDAAKSLMDAYVTPDDAVNAVRDVLYKLAFRSGLKLASMSLVFEGDKVSSFMFESEIAGIDDEDRNALTVAVASGAMEMMGSDNGNDNKILVP